MGLDFVMCQLKVWRTDDDCETSHMISLLAFFGGALTAHLLCDCHCSNPLGFCCDFFTFCLCFLIFGNKQETSQFT